MRAGKGSSDLYLEQWRRESRPCQGELDWQAQRAAQVLECEYSSELLERMVKDKGNRVELKTMGPLSKSRSNRNG